MSKRGTDSAAQAKVPVPFLRFCLSADTLMVSSLPRAFNRENGDPDVHRDLRLESGQWGC